MRRLLVFTMFMLALFLAACGPQPSPTAEAPATSPPSSMPPATALESPLPEPTAGAAGRTLTVMTHSSFDASEEVIAAFQESCNCQVQFLEQGDTGLMLNQALLSKDNPLADVIYGVDNTFLSRALQGDILEAYESPVLADIPDEFELDPSHRMLPVDYGDVCLNYDKAWFEEQGLAPPSDLPDLISPDYAGLTVVENPATSSPGLAFLLVTVGRYGESGDYTYLDYWADLRANDVLVTDGWEDAYYGSFTYASDGDRPIVVSYASSPPVEVYFAEDPFEEAPTGVVTADQSCFRQIEFVGILRGTENRDLAEQWIDFMLGVTFQEDIPLRMFVFPANSQAELPEVFVKFAQIPENPVTVDPDAIEENREQWIEAWLRTTLR
ncbi:MAG: thiamine ABC transporter substrate-binding protein [Anaerolineae bacterium]|nr:thiamine ABC transporter substrate-binding protein [Anaerolineae bacterium]